MRAKIQGELLLEFIVQPDGSVEVRMGTQDLGVGTRTSLAIVAADTFEHIARRSTA